MRLIWTRSTRTRMVWLSRMKNTKANDDVVDTKESLGADEDCLMRQNEKCTMTDNQSDEHQSACNKHAGRVVAAPFTWTLGLGRPT